MKKLWNVLRRLSGDNRGAGIVVVLVSMTCVALMGASVLLMSYTALSMRATERQASKDFYNAETAMDEIRAGVQTTASDAIAVSYKAILETYSQGRDISHRFGEAFTKALKKSDLLVSDSEYDPAVLAGYVTPVPVGVGTVVVDALDINGDSVGDPNVDIKIVEGTIDTITLQNVHVTYTAANGDVTTITSDLVIGMPDLAYTTSAASVAGLPQHALIAKDVLSQDTGNSEINISGSAYVGSIDLTTTGSKLIVSNGTLVCADTATIGGGTKGGRLVTGSDVNFWAGRIAVNGGSTLSLNGQTRVLDDLELAGTNASVTLNGSYYGFGDGTPDSGTSPVPNRSSAILVNGRESTLNVSGLNRLMLAGRAYISDSLFAGHDGYSQSVGMVESVAVRVDQQMYLIDPVDLVMDVDTNGDGTYDECDKPVTQNPFITTGTPRVRLKNADASGKDPRGFGLAYRQYTFAGQQIVYCFMDFEDPGTANTYFEQRFSNNSSLLNSYLVIPEDPDDPADETIYSNLNASGVGTLGYTVSGKDGNYTLSRANGVLFDCTGMRSTFNQLKKTLIDFNPNPGPGIDNPYEYIVKTSEVTVPTFGTKYFKDEGGVVRGVIVNSNYEVNNAYPNLRVVIATGDVTINTANYTGLVISGGNITISGDTNIAADNDGVIDAFGATNGGRTLGSYLRNGGTNYYGEDISGQSDGWHLDTLVTYKNWTKN